MFTLDEAKTKALTRSTEIKKPVYVDIDGDGSHSVTEKQTPSCLFAFQDGKEVPMPAKSDKKKAAAKAKAPVKSQTKTKTKMATATKKPAKKAAAPAKKEKPSTAGLIGKATTILLSKADWAKVEKAVEAGKGTVRELATKGILKMV